MFYQRTDRSKQALAHARQEAKAWNHVYLGCEHILMGLLKTEGVAASALHGLDIDETKARTVMAELLKPGESIPAEKKWPLTLKAKAALKKYAKREARMLHHHYIGTEHILLGLQQDEENIATRMLKRLGLQPDQVREAVMTLILPGC